MKSVITFFCLIIFLFSQTAEGQNNTSGFKASSETEECISCHEYINPGLVESWKNSLHSQITPGAGLLKTKLQRRISADSISAKLKNVVVGCFECHSLNTSKHADSFEHNGYRINVVVSSADCATCHPVEKAEYNENLMSHAYGNLANNSVYADLKHSINGNYVHENGKLNVGESNNETESEACFYCHGTKLEVTGTTTRETDFGELAFPVIKGWPNQGVGRINTDGSLGACTSCHPRHDFSIETARKPYTCAQCHKGPDVPAYKVYIASKHGNIYQSKQENFDFNSVPWKIGENFTVPTCATCHAALLVNGENEVVAKRTHQFNDRLSMRIFGVPYAQAHPLSPDVSIIKNSAGLPLSSDLNGKPASKYLISEAEQTNRNNKMKSICNSCHSAGWTDSHFARLANTIEVSNQLTLASTSIVSEAWDKGLALGLNDSESIFDEAIERDWVSSWLFYANSMRFASAMGGGGDYGVFANGRYQMTNKIIEMQEWLELHKKIYKKK